LVGENLKSEYNSLSYKIDAKKSELLEENNKPKKYDEKGKEMASPELIQKYTELTALNQQILQTIAQIINTSKEELNKTDNKVIKEYNEFLEKNQLK
jgi:hypothetical protein